MLPTLVARDIEQGLSSYVRKEFPIATRGLNRDGKSVLEEFLDQPGALTKGPWVEVNLPFRVSEESGALPFVTLQPEKLKGFRKPYAHQRKAFERLRCDAPASTIIATGTGSGKTECFLYPILDYCLTSKQKGIKAIIIYPMNALASDQERRLAGLIEELRQAGYRKIRGGIFTGDSDTKSRSQTAVHLVSDHDELRRNPPDILLTNYRMLDFLLMRPQDQSLWKDCGPGVLRYLAVDELHTFDGAQGTDLACLIRRLRDCLGLTDTLTCVGTSATVGSDAQALCDYASNIFATSFDEDTIIREDRLDPEEYLASFGDCIPQGGWPDEEFLRIDKSRGLASYLSECVRAWFKDYLGFDGQTLSRGCCENLGRALPHLEGFRRLVRDCRGLQAVGDLAKRWAEEIEDIRNLSVNPEERTQIAAAMIDGLIAMVSQARGLGGVPFLQVRSQLWIRELSRAVVTVSRKEPRLALAADLQDLSTPLAMPLIGCRECNRAAWGGMYRGDIRGSGVRVKPDLKLFYDGWFGEHRDVRLFYPIRTRDEFDALVRNDVSRKDKRRPQIFTLCPSCHQLEGTLHLTPDDLFADSLKCKECNCEDIVVVWVPDLTIDEKLDDGTQTKKLINRCPHCGSLGSLRIFGGSNSALSAAAIGHINASAFAGDHKIIAFSDSVQDAAHRAGFIEARNYLSVVRHAIVHFMQKQGSFGQVQLYQALREIPAFWLREFANSKGLEAVPAEKREILAKAAFLATFIPQDHEWWQAWHIFSKAVLGRVLQPVTDKDGKNGWEEIESTPHDALVCTYERDAGPYGSWKHLYECTRERLIWEVLIELGYRSSKGRSVTRIGAVTVHPDGFKLQQAIRKLRSALKESLGIEFGETTIAHFLTGVLEHMRTEGAFDPEDFSSIGAPTIEADFGGFLKGESDFKSFNLSAVLPTYGQRFPAPSGVTLHTSSRAKFQLPVLRSNKGRITWFEDWAMRLLTTEDALIGDAATLSDLFEATFEVLTETKLVNAISRKDDENNQTWALTPRNWMVSGSMRKWCCTHCGRQFLAASDATKFWQQMPCLSQGCSGTLREEFQSEDESLDKNFYSTPPVRVNAREHTALVDGDTRKSIEKSFGGDQALWSVNLLSATPTLEMGIDIGALSSVLQCTMPPSRANYLQRIGRAGRRDGNALALTVAGRTPHGQYHWLEPEEMLKAEVTPPGVFLRAVSVLERQMTAFALGKWVRLNPTLTIPNKLGQVLDALANGKQKDFPDLFLSWIEENSEMLLSEFIGMFSGVDGKGLNDEARESLRTFLQGRQQGEALGLTERIRSCLESVRLQREGWRREARELKNRLKRLKAKPKDEATEKEIQEVEQHYHAVLDLINNKSTGINYRNLFNFLTDEGLLPNYAFPEEGVTVESIVIKHRDPQDRDKKDTAGRYRPYRFSFSRGAAQALGDVSLNRVFYANQFRLRVDQARITPESLETWRLCDECAYSEKVVEGQTPAQACPRCGSPSWGGVERLRKMLRMREVVAHADVRRDRIDDREETRERDIQTRKVLITEDPGSVLSAWKIADNDFGFGFEFLKAVTIREINFGPLSVDYGAEVFRVAGEKVMTHGFKICSKCGMIYKPNLRKGEIQHDFTCPYRDKPEDKVTWVEGMFLYREMRSEAIRIRVPVSSVLDAYGANRGVRSFVAALKLGLRLHFKGSVDHLAIGLQSEPTQDGSGRADYIILYDTIPGGSGYLKDLLRKDAKTGKPEAMPQLFRDAYQAVEGCVCAENEEKDGCYRCVYRSDDYASREFISRRVAEELLERIASYKADQYLPTSHVGDVQSSEASVLERMFRARLEKIPGIAFTRLPVRSGRRSFELRVKLSDQAKENLKRLTGRESDYFTWQLLSQIDLTTKHDKVAHPSRPDFTFRPKLESLLQHHPQLQAHVFTDGWRYHKGILSEDTLKRQSILNEHARVWSITWEDVCELTPEQKAQGKTRTTFCEALRNCDRDRARKGWNILQSLHDKLATSFSAQTAEDAANRLTGEQITSFDWLCAWLTDPAGFSLDMQMAMRFTALGTKPIKFDMDRFPRPITAELSAPGKMWWLGSVQKEPFARITRIDQPQNGGEFATALRINDALFADSKANSERLKNIWARFWQYANALQFAGRLWICTTSNEEDECYAVSEGMQDEKPAIDGDNQADAKAWGALGSEFSEDEEYYGNAITLIRQMQAAEMPYCDDVGLDGAGGETFSKATGFGWQTASGMVFLFHEKDLEGEIPAETSAHRIVVARENDGNWITEIKQLLASRG